MIGRSAALGAGPIRQRTIASKRDRCPANSLTKAVTSFTDDGSMASRFRSGRTFLGLKT
jgi:hypothetical protein